MEVVAILDLFTFAWKNHTVILRIISLIDIRIGSENLHNQIAGCFYTQVLQQNCKIDILTVVNQLVVVPGLIVNRVADVLNVWSIRCDDLDVDDVRDVVIGRDN